MILMTIDASGVIHDGILLSYWMNEKNEQLAGIAFRKQNADIEDRSRYLLLDPVNPPEIIEGRVHRAVMKGNKYLCSCPNIFNDQIYLVLIEQYSISGPRKKFSVVCWAGGRTLIVIRKGSRLNLKIGARNFSATF